ncbi:MAG TPA: tetratricopeptide repeat protein [Polyangiaceae bacterium]|nr:tetratricopeptide repeat protein [Polyangiaceae bacterium]
MIYLTIAFSLWMLIDALRRGASMYWVLILIVFFPIGSFVYFFAVKFKDYKPLQQKLFASIKARPSLSVDALMARYEASPTAANQLALATAFYDQERFDQAATLFQDVLERQPSEPDALWGLARVRRSQGNPAESLRLYQHLIEKAPRHGELAAALEYAEALWDAGHANRCLEILEDIADESKRLNHRLAYAHYLVQGGDKTKARNVLKRALHDHEANPSWLKQKERQWASAASDLLRKLDSA